MAYKRLNLAERMEIFKGLYHLKMSPSKIAKKLNRSPSTITREIKKGSEDNEYNPFLCRIQTFGHATSAVSKT